MSFTTKKQKNCVWNYSRVLPRLFLNEWLAGNFSHKCNTHNDSSMSTHVEIIVSRMNNLSVNHSSCRKITNKKKYIQIIFTKEKWEHLSTMRWGQWNTFMGFGTSQFKERCKPGGTFSVEPAWKSFVWWFFCATRTVNLGSSSSLSKWRNACKNKIKNKEKRS